uniref:Homocitrate synthase n=1 Tax=Candidatus Methanophaga sp. ANME-1 ERB7 TaxID=2759913 RepID=A0A7G9ZC50_9EURY|nr:homocitrate synthase [Methanosarcinales archaeon ANME-1 ERB7]
MIKNDSVTITDVSLREYGQNIPANYLHIFIPEIRVEIALRLIDAGIRNIEILSCVHPKISPAMNEEALKKITKDLGRINGVNLITLVPNKAGYKNFLELGLGSDGYNHTMGIFFSAIEAHNIANLGRSLKETINEYKKIMRDASSHNIRIIGYVSAAFGYFEPESDVLIKPDLDELNNYIDLLLDFGADTVTLSDLQGVANKERTTQIFESILYKRTERDTDKLGYHPHHVSGKAAIANSKIAYDLGISRFDSSLGGTGGCVTGAPGNQPTEMLIHFFNESGIETSVDEKKLFSLTEMVQKELYSKIPLDKD